jgi:hypothetical protein
MASKISAELGEDASTMEIDAVVGDEHPEMPHLKYDKQTLDKLYPPLEAPEALYDDESEGEQDPLWIRGQAIARNITVQMEKFGRTAKEVHDVQSSSLEADYNSPSTKLARDEGIDPELHDVAKKIHNVSTTPRIQADPPGSAPRVRLARDLHATNSTLSFSSELNTHAACMILRDRRQQFCDSTPSEDPSCCSRNPYSDPCSARGSEEYNDPQQVRIQSLGLQSESYKRSHAVVMSM